MEPLRQSGELSASSSCPRPPLPRVGSAPPAPRTAPAPGRSEPWAAWQGHQGARRKRDLLLQEVNLGQAGCHGAAPQLLPKKVFPAWGAGAELCGREALLRCHLVLGAQQGYQHCYSFFLLKGNEKWFSPGQDHIRENG